MLVRRRALRLCRWTVTCQSSCITTSACLLQVAPESKTKTQSPHFKKENFIRDKINVNIGTLGAAQHGKTVLSAAITKVLSHTHSVPFKDVSDIDNAPSEIATKQSQNVKHLEWWTDSYRFSHSDLPGNPTYLKNTVGALSLLDVVILCIRADEGVTKDTLNHYFIAKHLNIPTVIPFINVSTTTDEEVVDLVRLEIEEYMKADVTENVVVGNALESLSGQNAEAVDSLLGKIQSNLKLRERNLDEPFVMLVEQSGTIPGRGIFTGGRVAQGKAEVGDTLEVFAGGITSNVVMKDLEIFRKTSPDLQAGDRGGGFLKKSNKLIEIKRGNFLYDPAVQNWACSRMWRVKARLMEGEGTRPVTGRAMLFHRGSHESAEISSEVLSDSADEILTVSLRQEIMACVNDPVILKTHDTFILGHLLKV